MEMSFNSGTCGTYIILFDAFNNNYYFKGLLRKLHVKLEVQKLKCCSINKNLCTLFYLKFNVTVWYIMFM